MGRGRPRSAAGLRRTRHGRPGGQGAGGPSVGPVRAGGRTRPDGRRSAVPAQRARAGTTTPRPSRAEQPPGRQAAGGRRQAAGGTTNSRPSAARGPPGRGQGGRAAVGGPRPESADRRGRAATAPPDRGGRLGRNADGGRPNPNERPQHHPHACPLDTRRRSPRRTTARRGGHVPMSRSCRPGCSPARPAQSEKGPADRNGGGGATGHLDSCIGRRNHPNMSGRHVAAPGTPRSPIKSSSTLECRSSGTESVPRELRLHVP